MIISKKSRKQRRKEKNDCISQTLHVDVPPPAAWNSSRIYPTMASPPTDDKKPFCPLEYHDLTEQKSVHPVESNGTPGKKVIRPLEYHNLPVDQAPAPVQDAPPAPQPQDEKAFSYTRSSSLQPAESITVQLKQPRQEGFDLSRLVKENPPSIEPAALFMDARTAMQQALTPRTSDGTLLDNMSIGQIAQAKIPVFSTPATPTPEHPIRPIAYAQEFAEGKLPDDLHYVDGFVSVEEDPNGKPIPVTTFADPVRNLTIQDRAALELGRRMQQSGNAALQSFPKQEEAPIPDKNVGMNQSSEFGTVSDCPSQGCLNVSTNKGICRLTNFRIIPLESRMILGKLEHGEPRLEYTFEIVCGAIHKAITVGAAELDNIVKVIQAKIPTCTVTPIVLKASLLISNYVREQIMELPQKIHVQRTGFLQLNGVWIYVHDGAVPPDPSIVFNTGRCIPDDRHVSDVQAFCNATSFLDICCRDELIIPLWLLAHLGPLFQLFHEAGRTPRFVTVLTGRSGSLKTSMSLILFRLFQDQGQTPTASFRDTETAMEIKLGELNGSVGIFDDLRPPVSSGFQSKGNIEKFEAIIRAVGDHVAKARSNTNLGKAKEFIPSGCAIVTAEDLYGSQSTLLRCLCLSISKGDIDGAKLRHFQNSPDLITTHMSRFLAWVGKHGQEIVNTIRQHYPSHLFERAFTELRLVDTAATLMTCAYTISTYAQSIGAMTDTQAQAFIDRCIQAVENAVLASEDMTKEANPCVMYLEAIFSLMDRGDLHLAENLKVYQPEYHDGFLADQTAWLDYSEIYAKITRYYSRLNVTFPLKEQQLAVHLGDANLIEVTYEKRNGTQKRLFTRKSSLPNRKRMQVLHLDRAQSYLEENANN